MQASLDINSLKHVIKALTCLAKYGDDVVMYTTPESLTFSATNTTATAYCRFRYNRPFFSRFHAQPAKEGDVHGPQGQVNAKSLLAILKHRTVEKAADKCELSIVEGGEHEPGNNADDSEHDSLESRLIVRLYCKHGVVKTHRLLLHSTELVMPSTSDSPDESRLTVAPKAIRDLIEHFPFPRGPKYDPKLIWKFEDQEIFLRGQDASLEAEGKGLTTELSLSASEFEVYDVLDPPVSICFHIREFQATLLLAEHLGLNLIIRFLDSTSPIYIEIEGDLADTLFVIATSQIINADNLPSSHASSRGQQNGRTAKVVQRPQQQQQQYRIPSGKRKRGSELDAEAEEGTDNLNDDGDRNDADDDSLYAIRDVQAGSRASSVASSRKRPMKAAVKADRESLAREMAAAHSSQRRPPSSSSLSRSQALVNAIIPPLTPPPPPASMPPPSLPHRSSPQDEQGKKKEPLFLPGSQLSQAIHDSGWGMLEGMDADEFDRMMEDGDELDDESEAVDKYTHTSSKKPSGVSRNPSSRSDARDGDADEDVQMQEVQNPNPNSSSFFGDSEEIDQLADDEDSVVPGDQAQAQDRESSFGLYYDETETETQFGPTQPRSELGMSSAGSADVSKVFKPLFDD